MPVIDISTLQNEAVTYQKDLRFFPYFILMDELSAEGISLVQIANSDVKTSFQRKAGIMRPYDPNNIDYADLGKAEESKLTLETIVGPLKDSILNYNAVNIVNSPTKGKGFNQEKEHPLKDLFSASAIKTFSEDLLFSAYGSERNIADRTPMGAFDGFDTIIDAKIADTSISAGNGNLIATGAIAGPISETDYLAIDKLATFVRSAHFLLRRNGILKITHDVYLAAIDALENRYKYKDTDINAVETYINKKAKSNIKLRVSMMMGTGDRIQLTTPGNLELGFNTFSDIDFIKWRDPWEDPNLVQAWIQAGAGARILSVHEKVFAINDGNAAYNSLSGDYSA